MKTKEHSQNVLILCLLYVYNFFCTVCQLLYNRQDFPSVFLGKNRRRADSYDSQPEWFTNGPKSQSDTMELRGFNEEERVIGRYA